MPGVGQNIALHALLATRDFAFLISAFPIHSASFYPILLHTYLVMCILHNDSVFCEIVLMSFDFPGPYVPFTIN